MRLKNMFHETQHSISNHNLIRFIGSDATNFFSFLEDKFEYYKKLEKLTTHENEEGYFFVTIQEIEKTFGFKEKTQRTIIKILKEKGFIKQANFGMPAKRYFKINNEIVFNYFVQFRPSAGTYTPERSVSSAQAQEHYTPERSNCTLPKGETSPYKNILYTKKKDTKINKYMHHTDENPEKSASTHAASPIRAADKINFNYSSGSFEGITDVDRSNWRVAYPLIDIDQELAQMVEWIQSNPKRIKKLWRRFITMWLNRSNERKYNRGSYHSTGQDEKRRQFEIRHTGFQKDNSPRDPSMTLDCSGWRLGEDGKWIPG